MITRYVIMGLALLLAAAGVKIYFLADEVSTLELTIERNQKEAAQDLARKLTDQAAVHANVVADERRRRLTAERDNDQLLKRIREVSDAKDRLAASLRLAVNELFDRARHQFGTLPADSSGSSRGGAVPGQEPLNDDLVRELAEAWAWCERGWKRVQDIAQIQQACSISK